MPSTPVGNAATDTIAADAQKAISGIGGGGIFSLAAGQVAQRAVGRVGAAVEAQAISDVAKAVGGPRNLQVLENIASPLVKSLGIPGLSGKSTPSAPSDADLEGAIASILGGTATLKDIAKWSQTTQWGVLNALLLAQLVPCTIGSDGSFVAVQRGKDDGDLDENGVDLSPVFGPITDSNMDASFNWHSPFEGAGPESKIPTLMAMIQSGGITGITNALQSLVSPNTPGLKNAIGDIGSTFNTLVGRTGITKLNSRLVFSGCPPIKLSFTLHFRAYKDARNEVLLPYKKLFRWATPQKLAPDGIIASTIDSIASGNGGLIRDTIAGIFPSMAPKFLQFTFAGESWPPMVIEHISNPIHEHIGVDGAPVYRAVQVTLATLTALDQADINRLFK